MSNIDEKAKNNFILEMRIFENYEKVKYEIIKVIDFLRHAETNLGMCRIFDNQNHEFWHSVIKPWFTPQRFNIEIVYFGYYNPTIIKLQGEGLRIEGRIWYRIPLENLEGHEYLLGTAFWFPISKEHNDNRIKILECALEDLERIKREGEPELPPLTFEDEPIMY